jgi:hypothetical protein
MPISDDEVLSGVFDDGAGGAVASPITIPKIFTTSPTVVTVEFYLIDGAVTKAPTSVTYGGTPITISSYDLWPATNGHTLYYGSLISPPSGAQNLVINYSGSAVAWYLITFWTGDVGSVSWTTRAPAVINPVVNIAKAASSAIVSFVQQINPTFGLDMPFIGPGTAREIQPAGSGTGVYGATQEPAQGTGDIDWNDGYFGPYETSHVSAEIIAAVVIPVGDPLTTIRARVRRFLSSARQRTFDARPRTR